MAHSFALSCACGHMASTEPAQIHVWHLWIILITPLTFGSCLHSLSFEVLPAASQMTSKPRCGKQFIDGPSKLIRTNFVARPCAFGICLNSKRVVATENLISNMAPAE